MTDGIIMDGKFYGEVRKVKDDSIVPDGTWICFLVKDDAFAATLPAYLRNCIKLGADEEHVESVKRMIKRVNAWRLLHPDRCKVPDAKGEKLLA